MTREAAIAILLNEPVKIGYAVGFDKLTALHNRWIIEMIRGTQDKTLQAHRGRLVVLPDYQGVGIATRFLKIIAEHYKKQGYDFSIVTSAKNLIYALNKSNDWLLQRYSANNCLSKKSAIDYKRSSMRSQCKTASFFYKKAK